MNPHSSPTNHPVHRLAWIGFAVAVVSVLLAWYGSLHAEKHVPNSPLRHARGDSKTVAEPGPWYEKLVARGEAALVGGSLDQQILALTERSAIARWLVSTIAFGLPLILGLLATYLGATAMRLIERSGGRYAGYFQAVCSIMLGGLASVISGCMIFSIFVWPWVPSVYTR